MDRKAPCLCVGARHEEWLGFSTKNVHGRAARDSASPLGCELMVTRTAHIDGGVLGLVLIDVPDIVGVRVGSLVGTSDHSALFIDVVLKKLILTWCVGRSSISRTLWTGSWLEEM